MSHKKPGIKDMFPKLDGEFEKDKSGKQFFYPVIYTKHAKIGFPVKKYRSIREMAKNIKKAMEKVPSPYVLEFEYQDQASPTLRVNTRRFKKSNNSVYALKIFMVAHQAGLYPPMPVLNYLSEIFKDWFEQKGEKTLDELLELNLTRGERETFFKKSAREERDRQLCLDVARLNKVFKISIVDACGAVVARLNSASSGYQIKFEKLKKVSPKTLYSIYYKKIINIGLFLGTYKEGKTEFIRKFPQQYIKEQLIPKYPFLTSYL